MAIRDIINRYIRTPIQNVKLGTTEPLKESLREIGSDITGRDYTQPISDVKDVSEGKFVSTRYGGGAGGISTTSLRGLSAEQKRQLEIQRQREQTQEALNKARQELINQTRNQTQIELRNITSIQQRQQTQRELNQTIASISEWKPKYEKEYYNKPPSQVAKEFINIMKENIKQIPKREQEFRNPFEAFKGAGKRISETKEKEYSPIVKTGTIAPDESPYYTYGELQTQADISREINVQSTINKYQSKIDEYQKVLSKQVNEGEINVEEANKKLADKIKKINENLNKDLNKLQEIRYFKKGVQTGEIVYETSKQIPSLVSLATPITSVLYGTYLASESEKKAPIVIESAKKGVPLYPDVKVPIRERVESSLFIGAGAFRVLGKIRKVEGSIVKGELERLSEQPFKFKGKTIKTERGDITKITGVQRADKLKTEVTIVGRTTREGRNIYFTSGGGEAKVTGELSWNVLGGGKPTYIVNVQQFQMGGKGLGFRTTKVGELFLGGTDDLILRSLAKGKLTQSVGTTTIIPTESTGMLFQTRRAKPYLVFPSPELKYLTQREIKSQAKFISEEFIKNYQTGGIITKDLGSALSLKLPKSNIFIYTSRGDIGRIKIVYPKISEGVKMFKGGLGKKSSQQYLQSLYTPDLLQPISKITTKSAIKIIPKPSTEIIPLVSGAETTLIKPEIKTEVQPVILSGKFQDMTGVSKYQDMTKTKFGDLGVTKNKFDVLTKEVSKQKETQKNILGLKAPQKESLKSQQQIKQKTLQKEALALSSLLLQKQRLKQQQVQRLTQQLKTKLKQPQKQTYKFPTPIKFGLFTLISDVKKGKVKDEEIFEVFGKRFGKDIKLFETPEKKKAEAELSKFLRGTLGRSGFITKAGEKIESSLLLSPMFRRAKREPKRVVQKARFSLSAPSEVQEIQYFRGKSRGKRGRKNINWFS